MAEGQVFRDAGSQSTKPAKISTLYSSEAFTGLWTLRSPFRDGATPYLIRRFYQGTRFDTLIAGSNVELSPKLTLTRSPGHTVYNGGAFPAVNRFFEFHTYINNNSGIPTEGVQILADFSATVRNITGPSSNLTLFTKATGSMQTDFQSVGNTCYMGDGIDLFQYVLSKLVWKASTVFSIGQFIVDPVTNTVQKISSVSSDSKTGGSVPSFSSTVGNTTADNHVTWVCCGTNLHQLWGLQQPTVAPVVTPTSSSLTRFWRPNTATGNNYSILDKNGNVQWANPGFTTGGSYPSFNTKPGGLTADGGGSWVCLGPITTAGWQANHVYGAAPTVIVDQNGNLQFSGITYTFTSGSSVPSFSSTPGAGTMDNTVFNAWFCAGTANVQAYQGWNYTYAWNKDFTGEVSQLSASVSTGPVLGTSNSITVTIPSGAAYDTSIDNWWLFRTVDGGSSPLFDVSTPMPNYPSGTNSVADTTSDANLNPFLIGDNTGLNAPPPPGLKNLSYHLNRVWGSIGNVGYYSTGPDINPGVGNGADCFFAENVFELPGTIVRYKPTSSGMIAITTNGLYLIPGSGTVSDPISPPVPFVEQVAAASYNAVDFNGTTIYCLTTEGQLMSLDVGTGVSNIGFPIGDVIQSNISPTAGYVTWHVGGTLDQALYLSDGSTGWYRWMQTMAPETNSAWSPFRTVTGGVSAVQSIETTVGVHQLLVGPASSGPILVRNLTTWQDNGTAYTCTATIGSLVLANPGQLAELDFITTESTATGTQPTVAVLLDEVSGGFTTLANSVSDPPFFPASSSVYSLRYYFNQANIPAACRHLQIKLSWIAENFGSELLTYSLAGAHYQEQ